MLISWRHLLLVLLVAGWTTSLSAFPVPISFLVSRTKSKTSSAFSSAVDRSHHPIRKKGRIPTTMVQSFNLPGILAVGQVLRSPHLLLPHISVKHIGLLDFKSIRNAGVQGIIFDKDNTLTAPYQDNVHEDVQSALAQSKEVFGDSIVILSNSAGTLDDKDHIDAARIEASLGIHVLRHKTKKPGAIPEVLDYFRKTIGPSASYQDLCMIGDRLLTDVMWGNTQGMLTVHTQILTEVGDNFAASIARRLENRASGWLQSWHPPEHPVYTKIKEQQPPSPTPSSTTSSK